MSHSSRVSVARLAAIGVISAAAFALPAAAANAADVALFTNPSYVDFDPIGTAGGANDNEADNLRAAISSFGDSVALFDAIDGPGISAALAGKDTLVLPEQENAALAPSLDAGARAAIRDFVAAGGTLVVSSDYTTDNFINAVFGFATALSGGAGTYDQTAESAASGPFAGGPASLPNANGTDPFDRASLPSGSTAHYLGTPAALEAAVWSVPYGKGTIVYLGYDFFDSDPPNAGGQDGGWIEVLRRAVSIVPAADPVVAPAPTPPPPPAPPVAPVPPAPAPPAPLKVSMATQSARIDSQGRFALRVSCAGTGNRACRVRVLVRRSSKPLASRTLTLTAGQKFTMRVRPDAAMRRSLLRGSTVTVRVSFTGNNGLQLQGITKVKVQPRASATR